MGKTWVMDSELFLTPNGRLLLQIKKKEGPAEAWEKKASAACARTQAEGLFFLASSKPPHPVSPSISFWRDFSRLYLNRLCHRTGSEESAPGPVEPPAADEMRNILFSAPPMTGGEYLNAEILRDLWKGLDAWIRSQISSSQGGLAGWLKKNAPGWHGVGRVCFHLAENKKNPALPFAFLATYAPQISSGGKVLYKPARQALSEYRNDKRALLKLLSPVHEASKKSGFIKELADSGDIFHPLAWTPPQAYRFLQDVPVLEESGILVRLPDWWSKRPRPRVSVTIGESRQSRFNADSMLDFRVELTLGGEKLTGEDLKRLLNSEGGLACIKGRWVEVDREKLSGALEHWKKVEAEAGESGLSFIEGMRLLAGAPANLDSGARDSADGEWAFARPGKWLSEIIAGLREPDGIAEADTGKSFRGELRRYQKTGLNWLKLTSGLGLGACLADDMGLGKTIQILALLLFLREKGGTGKPSLLVLPASLLSNWKFEINRFAPSLRTVFLHPSENGAAGRQRREILSKTDAVLTTYGMLLRQKWLLEVNWRLVVLDEAQAIKNPSSLQTRTVKKLKSGARIALTGTPLENRLSDLWSLFDFLCPGLLGSKEKFKKFVKDMESSGHDRYGPLRGLVSPYILRRMKTDKKIISDLPEKTEMKAFCGLSRKQAAIYSKTVDELAAGLEEAEGMKRRGLVLAYLMSFKQICNHPSQFLGDGAYEPENSGKFDRLKEICDEIASRQEKALIFTQFREMTGPISEFLRDVFGREGAVLHGGTAVGKRRRIIDAFQEEDGPPFFVLSLKAGGVGLNLTAATQVIHFDRWWNPAVENQATDRTFRIGQRKNVVVHKFICAGTVEEQIDALIDEKIGLAEDILSPGGENMLTKMTDEELLKTVSLDINKAGFREGKS